MTDLLERARAIAGDRDSGAAELTSRLLPLLGDTLACAPQALVAVVRSVCNGQPAMAPLWHACAAALGDSDEPGTFARFQAACARAPAALARVGSRVILDECAGRDEPLLVTLSFSSTARDVLLAVQATRPVRMVCGEGRPRYEGRRLAETLNAAGIGVTLTTDAALCSYLSSATAVVVGADAIAATFWINKVGTFGLAAAAHACGVPVYVTATSDKALPLALAQRWTLGSSHPADVWPDAPPSIRVENRSFEAVPAGLATGFLTELGRLTPDDLAVFAERPTTRVGRLLTVLEG